MEEISVMVADDSHVRYVDTILQTIADAAKVRGTGIAKRSPEYVATKMKEGKAVIALQGTKFAGSNAVALAGKFRLSVIVSVAVGWPASVGICNALVELTLTVLGVQSDQHHKPANNHLAH